MFSIRERDAVCFIRVIGETNASEIPPAWSRPKCFDIETEIWPFFDCGAPFKSLFDIYRFDVESLLGDSDFRKFTFFDRFTNIELDDLSIAPLIPYIERCVESRDHLDSENRIIDGTSSGEQVSRSIREVCETCKCPRPHSTNALEIREIRQFVKQPRLLPDNIFWRWIRGWVVKRLDGIREPNALRESEFSFVPTR